jgi:hypothetical protein
MTLKTQVQSGRGLLADTCPRQHVSRLEEWASRSNFDCPHTMIISAMISMVLRRQPSGPDLRRAEPVEGDCLHGCNHHDRLELPPALRARKASLYPQVMAYPTSRPTFVASLDGLLSKRKSSRHGAVGYRSR